MEPSGLAFGKPKTGSAECGVIGTVPDFASAFALRASADSLTRALHPGYACVVIRLASRASSHWPAGVLRRIVSV
jgi:hypothetical protein